MANSRVKVKVVNKENSFEDKVNIWVYNIDFKRIMKYFYIYDIVIKIYI